MQHREAHAVAVQGQGGQLVGGPEIAYRQLRVAAGDQLPFHQPLLPHVLEQPGPVLADACGFGPQRAGKLPRFIKLEQVNIAGNTALVHLVEVDITVTTLRPDAAIGNPHLVAIPQGVALGLGGLLHGRGHVFHTQPQQRHKDQCRQGYGKQQPGAGKTGATDDRQLVEPVQAGERHDTAQQGDDRRQAHQLLGQAEQRIATHCQRVVVEACVVQLLDEADQAEHRAQYQQHQQPALDQVVGDIAFQDHRRVIHGCLTSTTSRTASSA